jgi:hypothetical protein
VTLTIVRGIDAAAGRQRQAAGACGRLCGAWVDCVVLCRADLHGKFGKTARFWILGSLNISVTDVKDVIEANSQSQSSAARSCAIRGMQRVAFALLHRQAHERRDVEHSLVGGARA